MSPETSGAGWARTIAAPMPSAVIGGDLRPGTRGAGGIS